MAVSEGEREGVERWRNQEGLASEATYWKPHAITAHCRWRAATDTTDGQRLQADLGYKPGVMTQVEELVSILIMAIFSIIGRFLSLKLLLKSKLNH